MIARVWKGWASTTQAADLYEAFLRSEFLPSAHAIDGYRGASVLRRPVGAEVEFMTVTYCGEWARYNNRTWESDSYNDWWHDQPWRSYPKWVSTNQNCDRMWWSGGGWRC